MTVPDQPETGKALKLELTGMSCSHCEARVGRALAAISGVTVNAVGINHASLSYDPAVTSVDAIERAVADAGYPVKG